MRRRASPNHVSGDSDNINPKQYSIYKD
jgi:hypothetical protein